MLPVGAASRLSHSVVAGDMLCLARWLCTGWNAEWWRREGDESCPLSLSCPPADPRGAGDGGGLPDPVPNSLGEGLLVSALLPLTAELYKLFSSESLVFWDVSLVFSGLLCTLVLPTELSRSAFLSLASGIEVGGSTGEGVESAAAVF